MNVDHPMCGNCAYRMKMKSGQLCCFRYPPTIHRVWFQLKELYPAVNAAAVCGEWRASGRDIVEGVGK